MALSKIGINQSEWTLIGGNVTSITFQNAGQQQIYINVTSSATPPVESVGLLYDIYQGELLVDPTLMNKSAGTFVWARTVTGRGYVLVEA